MYFLIFKSVRITEIVWITEIAQITEMVWIAESWPITSLVGWCAIPTFINETLHLATIKMSLRKKVMPITTLYR